MIYHDMSPGGLSTQIIKIIPEPLKILLSGIHFRKMWRKKVEKKVSFRVCLACKKSESISCCVRIRLMVWLKKRSCEIRLRWREPPWYA